MITAIIADTFLGLIFIVLVVFGFLAFLAWQKIHTYLTWNTRYQTAEYEQAVRNPKPKAPSGKPERKGRAPVSTDLVDLRDMEFDEAYKALEEEFS